MAPRALAPREGLPTPQFARETFTDGSRKATSSPGNSRPLTETMMPISGRRTVFRFGRSAAAFSAAAFGFVFLPGRQPFRRDGTFQQPYAYLRASAQKRVIARSATKALPNRIQPNVPGDAAGSI